MKKTNSISIGGIKIIIGTYACDELGNELIAKHCKKPLIVTDQGIERIGLVDYIKKPLSDNDIDYVIFHDVPSDPPSSVVEDGVKAFKDHQCDCVISVGGGSVMDCAKAINIMSTNIGSILDYDNSSRGGRKFEHDGHPLFSIPTTSGTGSEVTQYAVITDTSQNRKATIGDERLTSKVVFLTPLMTVGLPAKITAATGMDALAHGIEAYTSNRVLNVAGSSIISDTLAIKGIEMISKNLAKAYANGENIEARKNVMLGCTLTGLITQAGSGSAHGMGTPLGANYHVPHGISVGMLLPYVMEYNIPACPERYRDIAIAMGRNINGMNLQEAAMEAVKATRELLSICQFPVLKEYVKEKEELTKLSQEAMDDKCCQLNARGMTSDVAYDLYLKAWNEE